MSNQLLKLTLLLLLFLPIGCSDDDDDTKSAQLRYINTIFDASESRVIRGDELRDPDEDILLMAGEVTDYRSIESGRVSFFVFEDETPVLDDSIQTNLREETYSSAILVLEDEQESIIFVNDEDTDPGGGIFRFRFANFFDSENDVDVYLVNRGFDITELEPTFDANRFQDHSEYVLAADLDSRVVVTAKDTTDIILDSGLISFDDRKNYTFYLLPQLRDQLLPQGMLVIDGE